MRSMLVLRYAGYTWKESAQMLGGSVSALRSAFWRDVARVKGDLNNHGSAGHGRQAQQDIATLSDRRC